ncbi:MAG TPA: DUF4837 family protein [Flavobacteriaceae bacterium]|nr:DUF4837 family protein [Flavobacteriaceae bacterium]
MRFVYVSLVLLIFSFYSCSDKQGQERGAYLPTSNGNINSLQVVMPNDYWTGTVGETLREYFAAPTDGLPQDEPLFSMRQLPPQAFEGFVRNSRLFLYVNKGEKDTVIVKKNWYAKPQVGVSITAKSTEQLEIFLEDNHEVIIDVFKKAELKERQRRTNLSLLKLRGLKETFGIDMKVPSAYRIALATDNFYWVRKSLEYGTTNIIVYEVPLDYIKEDNIIGSIIKMRDEVGSALLPVEDDSPFITEAAYAPFLHEVELAGKKTYESKGTWEVQGAFMGGPFLNYAIEDKESNRYLIVEGFTHAPSVAKRDLQFELESIIKTLRFVNEEK